MEEDHLGREIDKNYPPCLDPNFWKTRVLVEPIDEVVLTPLMLGLTRRISYESSGPNLPEQGGILEGGFIGRKFYVFSQTATAMSPNGSLYVRNPTWLSTDVMKRFAERAPEYRTVMYHSHPRLTRYLLAGLDRATQDIADLIQSEIDEGVHEDMSFDDVLNDTMTRVLSEEDLMQTKGRYHLLVTPFLDEKDKYDHLRFYKIRNRKKGLVERIPIRLAHEEDGPIFYELDRKHQEATAEHKEEVYGNKDISKLTPKQRELAFLINQGQVIPERILRKGRV